MRGATAVTRRLAMAVALTAAATSVCDAQAAASTQAGEKPDFTVHTWGYIAAEFSTRVLDYSALRRKLEEGLPPLTVTDDSAAIRHAVRALAKRIRRARAGAKQGDIFTPAVSIEFKKALVLEMNAGTWAAIMDDNPGEFSNRINGSYQEKRPLSTVPPSILAALPRLPDDIQYRFLGPHLILLDTRANLIVDRIPFAIRWPGCAGLPCDERRARAPGARSGSRRQ